MLNRVSLRLFKWNNFTDKREIIFESNIRSHSCCSTIYVKRVLYLFMYKQVEQDENRFQL